MDEQRCVREVLAEALDLVETVRTNVDCGKVLVHGHEMAGDLDLAIARLTEARDRIRAKREAWLASG
jgi:hypothetical protein